MQKVVQRRLAAERQVARRAQRQLGKEHNAHEFNTRWQMQAIQKSKSRYFLEEKHRRREEYETGAQLAPRRDTGHIADTYGVVDPAIIQAPKLYWTMYKDFKSPFAEGDRVLIVKGQDAGKIGRVNEVAPDAGYLRLSDLRKVHFLLTHNCQI